MKSTTFSMALAVLTLTGGLAMAQPAVDSTPQKPNHGNRADKAGRGAEAGRMRDAAVGPFGKLRMASRLPDLTADQKAKLQAFTQENKAEAEALQKEFRDAMQTARENKDKDARKAAMEPVREKFKASELKVNSFLKGLLTQEQQTELAGKSTQLRQRALERVKDARDSRTTATASGDPARRNAWKKKQAQEAKADNAAADNTAGKKEHKKGKKHDGKKGKKWQKNEASSIPAAPATQDQPTSSSAPNPFAKQ